MENPFDPLVAPLQGAQNTLTQAIYTVAPYALAIFAVIYGTQLIIKLFNMMTK